MLKKYTLQLFILNDGEEPQSRFPRLSEIMLQIQNKQLLIEFLLETCQPNISPYDYEGNYVMNKP